MTSDGMDAHQEIMSYQRQSASEALRLDPSPRQSAVMALLYPMDNRWHIALTKRNEYPGAHSGQISLPGGKIEKSDTSLQHTAERECWEEIGIEAQDYEVIKKLTPLYIPPSNFIVNPFIGIMEHTPDFVPDPREVDRVIELPLDQLVHKDFLQDSKVQLSGTSTKLKVKAFLYEEEVIWGATAMILNEIRWMLRDL